MIERRQAYRVRREHIGLVFTWAHMLVGLYSILWRRGSPMANELQKLIDAARVRPFPHAEREAQRRSFAYGNTKIENPRITRATVDQQADALKQQRLLKSER